jgi:hypothetical protein
LISIRIGISVALIEILVGVLAGNLATIFDSCAYGRLNIFSRETTAEGKLSVKNTKSNTMEVIE